MLHSESIEHRFVHYSFVFSTIALQLVYKYINPPTISHNQFLLYICQLNLKQLYSTSTAAITMLSPRMPQRRAELDGASHHRQELPSAQLSHCMDSADLDCPMNWPLHRKLYTSAAAWLFTFAVFVYSSTSKFGSSANADMNSVNGLTCYTAGLSFVVSDFDFNPDNSPTYLPIAPTSGFSLYLFGVMFAPIVTPHIVERVGRSIVYFTCITLCGVFLLSGMSQNNSTSPSSVHTEPSCIAGFAQSFAGVAILRFFAGLFGGPCVVNIEGTFADIVSNLLGTTLTGLIS